MPKGKFRFYEELNDVLPEYRKKKDFEAAFSEKSSIRNIIENLGVSPSKVDLVLINGKSVDFNYILQDGDRVSVYPVFERLNIQEVTLLRKIPLRRIQFTADLYLKHMVKPMRILGFDVDFNPNYTTKDIIRISEKENRIILTTCNELLRSESVTHGILVPPGPTMEQVKYVIEYLDVKDRIRRFDQNFIVGRGDEKSGSLMGGFR